MLFGLGLDKGSTTSCRDLFRDEFRTYGQGWLLVFTVEDV